MRQQTINPGVFPVALLFGEKLKFETPQPEKFIYDPARQITEVYQMGETGTGGKIGTKSLKNTSTGTGGKLKFPKGVTGTPSFKDYNNDQKNEIDDSKYKDK